MKLFETLPRKTAFTIFALVLMAVPQAILSTRIKPPKAPVAVAAPVVEVSKPVETPFLSVPPGSLDSFYGALRRGGTVRVLHYGDSPTTADSITSDVRRLLQARFGNAGHGFLLIAKPWAWYGHAGMELDASGWKIEPASQARAKDGIHGLGGVSFRGSVGAVSTVTLADPRHTGGVVYYLAQPDGGDFSLMAGDTEVLTVHTAAEQTAPAFAEFALPSETRKARLTVTSGNVRLFGYRFDRNQAGVQYSSIGINGAQIEMAERYFEPHQWSAALRHENPDLVVLNYGTNESIYPEYVEKQYPDELRVVIGRIRAAVPHASLLIMSPMDRGEMQGAGGIVTPPALQNLVEKQKAIAAETGCAFFNTFEAMGGAGTMARWYAEKPRLVSADFMHPLPAGAAIVGKLFEEALMRGYEDTGTAPNRQISSR